MEPSLSLAALDVAGAPAQVNNLIEPGNTVLILGATGKSGPLSPFLGSLWPNHSAESWTPCKLKYPNFVIGRGWLWWIATGGDVTRVLGSPIGRNTELDACFQASAV